MPLLCVYCLTSMKGSIYRKRVEKVDGNLDHVGYLIFSLLDYSNQKIVHKNFHLGLLWLAQTILSKLAAASCLLTRLKEMVSLSSLTEKCSYQFAPSYSLAE